MAVDLTVTKALSRHPLFVFQGVLMRFLLLLFVMLPIIEITVLIKVGTRLGALPTLALLFLSAMAGLYILRRQGVSTLLRINQRLAVGEVPAREMLEGVVLAVGGALLLIPGFVTDVFGLLCLIPGVRQRLALALIERAMVAPATRGRAPFSTNPMGSSGGPASNPPNRVPKTIEGEFRRED